MWGVFVFFLMWAPDVALFFAHQEGFVPSVGSEIVLRQVFNKYSIYITVVPVW